MEFTYSSVVDAELDEVYAWHTRPGAIARLTPPWAPNVFADSLESLPLSAVLPWRHTRQFSPAGEQATLVTDVVATTMPARALRPVFVYRHRQLADDLAVQARARAMCPDTLTIAVTGSGGLIGTALTALLTTGGHRVIRLVRRLPRHAGERYWRPDDPGADSPWRHAPAARPGVRGRSRRQARRRRAVARLDRPGRPARHLPEGGDRRRAVRSGQRRRPRTRPQRRLHQDTGPRAAQASAAARARALGGTW